MQKNRERIGKVTEVNKAKEYLLQVSRAEHRIKRLKRRDSDVTGISYKYKCNQPRGKGNIFNVTRQDGRYNLYY